jgi:hypothetical protein
LAGPCCVHWRRGGADSTPQGAKAVEDAPIVQVTFTECIHTIQYTAYTVHRTPYTVHPYPIHHTPYTIHHTPLI